MPKDNFQYSKNDQRLKQEILARLAAHVELNYKELELYVRDGYVSLNGKVNSNDEKMTIEAIVATFDEVVDVANFLELRDAFESGKGDGLHDVSNLTE